MTATTIVDVPTIGSLVDGERRPTGRTYDVLDPNDGSVIARMHDSDAAEAAEAAEAASAASGTWAAVPIERRRLALERAADLLTERRDRLVELAIADTGARREVAEEMQVDAAITRLRRWAGSSADLLSPKGPDAAGGLSVELVRRPVGVVACISPYNFPLLAMVGKVAPALFSGNSVVMKPAPQDPLLVSELASALDQAVREVGGPAGTVNFVVGSSPESGAALVEHPGVRAVSFTGSTVVGTEIYRTAAPTMKRLLLELGGKGAQIVRADTPLEQVLPAVTRTWTYHSGQVCLTPSRVLAHRDVYPQLKAALLEVLQGLAHGDPRDRATNLAPIISAAQRSRIDGLVSGARADGFDVAQSSGAPEHGFHYPATLVSGVHADAQIMQEEVFGPVISLMEVEDDDHAVEVANSTRYGLYDYVYSADAAEARAVAARLESAQVGINTVSRHLDAPFGGNKLSGLGRTGGTYALDTYTDLQAFVTG